MDYMALLFPEKKSGGGGYSEGKWRLIYLLIFIICLSHLQTRTFGEISYKLADLVASK
jgi:hypothetical protein